MAKKILFAPDTSDHPNWGCRFMGDWYRRELARLGCAATQRVGSRWFFRPQQGVQAPATWADLQRIAAEVSAGRALEQVAHSLRDCDLVLLNGENFIRPGVVKGRMLLLLAYLASQVFGKPCVLTNLCMDLAEPALAEMVAKVLPGLAEVHVREAESGAAYAALVPGAAFAEFPDVGWTARPRALEDWGPLARDDGHFSAWPDVVEGFDPYAPYVTLSASSAYVGDDAAAQAAVPAFVELTRRLQALGQQVLLVASCEVDAAIMRRVAARTGRPLLGLNLPVVQGIDVLAHGRVHLGGRWHPGIFATTGGTPLVAFGANTHKMRTLMDQLQPQSPVFDPRRIGEHIDDIVAQATRQIEAGDGLRDALKAKAAAFAARVDGNLDAVTAAAR